MKELNNRLASSTDYQGRDPNNILSNQLLTRSSWHFFQAKSWLDYSLREMLCSSIQYAAFELRYGIEHLLFELLVLTKGDLTQEEYERALKDSNQINKMLKSKERPYEKLQNFSSIVIALDESIPYTPMKLKLSTIWKSIGIASEYLHFVGPHKETFESDEWKIKAISRLENEVDKFYGMTTLGLMRPETMEKNVKDVWADCLDDKITEGSVKFRLDLIKPVVGRHFQLLRI